MTGDTDNHWYIARDGQQHGPISETEIRLFVDNGHLRPTDLLWRPGFADWRPAPSVFPLPETVTPTDTSSQTTDSPTQAEPDSAATERKPDVSNQAAKANSPATEKPEKSLTANTTETTQGAFKTPQQRDREREPAATSKSDVDDGKKADRREPAHEKTATVSASGAVGSSTAAGMAATAGAAAVTAATTAAAGGRHSNQPSQPSRVAGQSPRQSPVGSASDTKPGAHAASPNSTQPSKPRYGALTPQPGETRSGADVVNASSGRGKTFALAAVLGAMIIGSGIYLVTQKDQIMSMFGASATGEVPVVTAEPVAAVRPDPALESAQSPARSTLDSTGSVASLQPEPDQGSVSQRQPSELQSPREALNNSTPEPAATLAPPRSDPPETAMLQPPGTAGSPTAGGERVPGSDNTMSSLTPTATQPDDGKALIDAYYQKSNLWQFIKRSYPDWYGAQMSETASMRSNGTPTEEATKTLVTGLVALRRRNADHALHADTSKLKAIATAFLANLQSLSEKDNDTCYGFISQGETSPQTIALFHHPQSAPKLEAQALTIFEAIDTGKAAPATHERPKKEDYDVLAAELGKLGWSQADLQLFADPKALAKAPPARVCSMVLDWFKAHVAISDAAVQERLLFETLRPVVAG